MSRDDVLMLEEHQVEAFVAEAVVPGVEVHQDRDVTWLVHPGAAWRNAAIMVRFSSSSAARRVDTLLRRYERHRRGSALWLSPLATPQDLSQLLSARGLRCQKYFPAMIRRLNGSYRPPPSPSHIEIRRVLDTKEFEVTPHPAIGRITTPLRRRALDRLAALVAEPAGRTRAFVARVNGHAVGALELFVGSDCAGIHGLNVLSDHKGRGIGSALLEHACREATVSKSGSVVLLASSEGQRLYQTRGFTEIGRFGYWYRSFQREH